MTTYRSPLGPFLADLDWTAGDGVCTPSPAAPSRVANGSDLCSTCRGIGTHLDDCTRPRFIAVNDPWQEPTIWSADPDRPAVLLARHQLGVGPEADALWALIVAAVEGARR